MLNLSVADIHTYYVLAGKVPVLVHNTGPGGCGVAAEMASKVDVENLTMTNTVTEHWGVSRSEEGSEEWAPSKTLYGK
jgi:hypothetical protein